MEGISEYPTNKPQHFVKPIIPGFLHEFLIPNEFFLTNMGGSLDGQGNQCKSGVLRSNSMKNFPVIINGQRLEAGWSEFSREHNLKIGDFVLLQHEGGLVFSVRVYGSSACEIMYPLVEAGDVCLPIMIEEDISNVNPIEVDDFVVSEHSMKKRKKVPIQPKTNASIFPQTPPKDLENTSFEGFFTFSSITSSKLYLPVKFSRENGLLKEGLCEMVLRDPKGRAWKVALRHRSSQLKGKTDIYIGGSGWKCFRVANGLKKGDHFRFELLKNEPIQAAKIYVVTPKTAQSSSAAKSKSASCKGKLTLGKLKPEENVTAVPSKTNQSRLTKKSKFVSIKAGPPSQVKVKTEGNITEGNQVTGHHSFCGVVSKDPRVRIPSDFARLIGLNSTCHDILLEDDKKRRWPIKLLQPHFKNCSSLSFYLGKGTTHFLYANCFKPGDYFTFELMEKSPKLIAKFHWKESAD